MALLGALVVVGCAVGGVLVWDGTADRRDLLVAARAIPAGHVVGPADLRAVSVGGAEGVSAVQARDAAGLVGRAATVPVPAGALIPAELAVGAGVMPPAGKVVLSVKLPVGAIPPEAGAGSAVCAIPVPGSAGAGRPSAPWLGWRAVLLGVESARSGDGAVVSLQVDETDAGGLAAAGSNLSIVLLAGAR